MDNKDRYFVVVKDSVRVEITKEEFISAERHQGFRPKVGDVATGGFSGGPLVYYSVRNGELNEKEKSQLVTQSKDTEANAIISIEIKLRGKSVVIESGTDTPQTHRELCKAVAKALEV